MRQLFQRVIAVFLSCFLFLSAFCQNISTAAGNGTNSLTGNGGFATNAGLPYPSGVCVDEEGNIYITGSNRVRKVTPGQGLISNFAGNGNYASTGDGGQATNASLRSPVALCVDKNGNVYIAEYGGNRVRKVAKNGIITTVAGNGTAGDGGDGGPATSANLDQPWGVAVDAAGNLFIADYKNFRIRKVAAATGIITTIAGNGTASFSGDGGPAINAGIAAPSSICTDKQGNVFFTEAHSGISCRVRKIDAVTGVITTVAGNNIYAHSGDGGPAVNASLFDPSGVSVDDAGNIFIAQYDDSRIRKVDAATGIITTYAGTGVNGFGGDGGPAINAMLHHPKQIFVDTWGTLYIADNNNHRVRRINAVATCPPATVTISSPSLLYCYNMANSFTATVNHGGANPSFQWKKNGVVLNGFNRATEIIQAAVGDVITCEVTGTNICGNAFSITSNSLTIQSNPGYNLEPEVTITATQDNICSGTLVTFTATNVSQSASPVFQWLVNGTPNSLMGPTFSTSGLRNGDRVECIMTVPHCNGGGSTKDYSNAITMVVRSQLNPKVSISPVAVAICKGVSVTFTAKPEDAGSNPSYQWKVNDLPVGTNSNTFTSSAFNDNDQVTCQITIDPALGSCANGIAAVSNAVIMSVHDAFTPSLEISASAEEICEGSEVTFTATGTNTGPRPTYQWQVNGTTVGTNSLVFVTKNLKDGDRVSCILTPVSSCSSQATSDAITMTVHPNPDVHFTPPQLVVEPGRQVHLAPVVQGSISYHEWQPANRLVDPSSLTPFTQPLHSTTTYRLLVQTPAGCVDTAFVTINVYNKLYMPDSFTPNGDGKNDVFRIPPVVSLRLKEFSVFDRWGNRVFTTTDAGKGWDGKRNGVPASADTYVYVVNGEDSKGPVFVKGTVLLVR